MPVLCAVVAIAGWLAMLQDAEAQAPRGSSGRGGSSMLTPFPEKDTWQALVIGDGFAEGLLYGLQDAFSGEAKLQVQRKRHSLRAIGRGDYNEELRDLEDVITKQKLNVAVILLGLSDRNGMRTANGRRLSVGADGWRQQYGARVDGLVRMLRARSVAVYWVGMPAMRREDWNEDIDAMNEVLRERATANGARFIDIYSETADESGEFAVRGPDITGKVVRLRDSDGIDFTSAGYRKLAFFVERVLKRDMVKARSERAIPLAGTEAEQKLINVAAKGARAASGNRGPNGDARSPAARAAAAWGAGGGGGSSGELRADNGKASFKVVGSSGKVETVTLDIVRPALAASVIKLVTRRDKGDKPSDVGETLTDTLSNGLMVMRSVTPTSVRRRGQGGAPSQQPFFLALTKGARLTPKPGRADDFRWPREDDLPAPPSGTADSAAGIGSPVRLRRPPKGAPRR